MLSGTCKSWLRIKISLVRMFERFSKFSKSYVFVFFSSKLESVLLSNLTKHTFIGTILKKSQPLSRVSEGNGKRSSSTLALFSFVISLKSSSAQGSDVSSSRNTGGV